MVFFSIGAACRRVSQVLKSFGKRFQGLVLEHFLHGKFWKILEIRKTIFLGLKKIFRKKNVFLEFFSKIF